MIGQALSEFQISLTRADAPIDRFARGLPNAMTKKHKKGAILLFSTAKCISCHKTAGNSFEMFSDFENHVLAVPQIAPAFGRGKGNVMFDGPNSNEDFGLAQVTGNDSDRYKFRTSPLRNVALQPTFFHNGAFTKLEDAIKHHLNPQQSVQSYRPNTAGIARDLQASMAPMGPVLAKLDPLVATPVTLTPEQFSDLVEFVKVGLMDKKASAQDLCKIIPNKLPSGMRLHTFQGCQQNGPGRIDVIRNDNSGGRTGR
jgi:cytochrome c peroxidase